MNYARVDQYGFVTAVLNSDRTTALRNAREGETIHEMQSYVPPNQLFLHLETGLLRPKRSWFEHGFPSTGKIDEPIVFQNIPAGTRVVWPDGFYSIETDGEISFDCDMEGEYIFIFEAPEYEEMEWTVHVTS